MLRTKGLETSPGFNRVIFRAAGLLGLTSLAACSGFDFVSTEEQQRHPTAEQLAAERDSSVSQFPSVSEGIDGSRRFCIEIGGKVLTITSNSSPVECAVNGTIVFIPEADYNSRNDAPMNEACAASNGSVEGVAIAKGDSFSVPACVTQNGLKD